MAERLSRKELYDLVWSEPLKTLCLRFGISDVALKKTCARSEIPTPERGYWAKKDVGKPTFQAPLPMRPPGMDDAVSIAVEAMVRTNAGTSRKFLASLALLRNSPKRSRLYGGALRKPLTTWLSRIKSGRGTLPLIVSSKRMRNVERSN